MNGIAAQSPKGEEKFKFSEPIFERNRRIKFGPPNKTANASSISGRKALRLHRGFCIPQEQRHNAYNREIVAPV